MAHQEASLGLLDAYPLIFPAKQIRQALRPVLDPHDPHARRVPIRYSEHHDYHRARRDVHNHLEKADAALNAGNSFLQTVEKLQPLDVIMDDINGYSEWYDKTLDLVDNRRTHPSARPLPRSDPSARRSDTDRANIIQT